MTKSKRTPPSLPRPSLLAPWIALGAGLGALAVIPDKDPTAIADALAPTVWVSNADASVTALAMTSPAAPSMVLPPPPRPPTPDVRFVIGSPSIGGVVATQDSFATDPSYLSAPARIDRMFAVAGEPTKELPSGFHHPLLSSRVPTVISDQPFIADMSNPYLEGIEAIYPDPSPQQWANLRWCESSGNYQVTNFSGKYRGAYQFDQATWDSVGGSGDPAAAAASEQDKRAAILYATRGSSPWPYCGQYLDERP